MINEIRVLKIFFVLITLRPRCHFPTEHTHMEAGDVCGAVTGPGSISSCFPSLEIKAGGGGGGGGCRVKDSG